MGFGRYNRTRTFFYGNKLIGRGMKKPKEQQIPKEMKYIEEVKEGIKPVKKGGTAFATMSGSIPQKQIVKGGYYFK